TVLEGDLKGTTSPGIYKLEKGRLTICLRDEKNVAKGYPKEFTADKGSGQAMITLEKIKEPAKPSDKPEDKAKAEEALKELQGEWKWVALEIEGKPVQDDVVKD